VQKKPAKGIYHKVKKGETFWSIARAYHVKLQDLAEVNNVNNPGLIEEGSVLFIPDANQAIDDVIVAARKMEVHDTAVNGSVDTKPSPDNDNMEQAQGAAAIPKSYDNKVILPDAIAEKKKSAKAAPRENQMAVEQAPARKAQPRAAEDKEEIQFVKRRFIWPVRGSVKTRFGIQPNKTYHNWIKIVSAGGTQVKSAASGTVIFSSGLPPFGETIIIRHADDFATVYTHLKERFVKIDQNVKKGTVIASMGETDEAGNAYMNFEVRMHGKPRNPLFFLP
jgi:lipoprotein NlpD